MPMYRQNPMRYFHFLQQAFPIPVISPRGIHPTMADSVTSALRERTGRPFQGIISQWRLSGPARLDQENWSHKMHFGMDRFSNVRNQLSLYGFVSGFSNEQDGFIEITKKDDTQVPSVNTLMKEDSDHNRSIYSSVYFRHRFIPGSEFILEGSYYLLRSQSGTELFGQENAGSWKSLSEPMKDEINFRAQFTSAIGEYFGMEAGLQHRFTSMHDKPLTSFHYTDQMFAGHIQGTCSGLPVEASGGLRVEHSIVMFSDVMNDTKTYLLPHIDLKYSIKPGNNVKISYRKRVDRPSISQLNPNPNHPRSV